MCGSGLHWPQRQMLHPPSPFLPQFCRLGHGLSLHRTQLGRQSGHPEPPCPLSEGDSSPPFNLTGTPAAWELSGQGPRHLGPESDGATWRIPHFLSSQLSTLPTAELGDLSGTLT